VLALGSKSLALVLALKVVVGLGLDHHCFHIIWTVSVTTDMEDSGRLEKILAHYVDTTNSVSFDSDTKFADIRTQMEFMPLGYLFERILAVPVSSALLKEFLLVVFF